jgi:hypothetical protein
MFQMTLIDESIQKKLFQRISQLNRSNLNPLEPLQEGNKTQLQELTKSCWVRVISAVPEKTTKVENKKKDGFTEKLGIGLMRLSSAFDQQNGNFFPKNEPLASKSGFGESNSNTFRPHSGITGITTSFQNHSIQTVTINWKMYDMDEFEDYRNAFLKHGRSVLVEFGWSSPEILGKVKVDNVDTMLEYFDGIQEKILEMNGDYYATCGLISGFDWNVVEGGGFECTTTLTSMGNTMFKAPIEAYIGGEFGEVGAISPKHKEETIDIASRKANYTFLSQIKQLNTWIGSLNTTEFKIDEQVNTITRAYNWNKSVSERLGTSKSEVFGEGTNKGKFVSEKSTHKKYLEERKKRND